MLEVVGRRDEGQWRLRTVGPHGGRRISISKRNSSGLSACRWLRALDVNRRLVLALQTACFSRVTFPSIVVPRTMRNCWRKRDRDQTRVLGSNLGAKIERLTIRLRVIVGPDLN